MLSSETTVGADMTFAPVHTGESAGMGSHAAVTNMKLLNCACTSIAQSWISWRSAPEYIGCPYTRWPRCVITHNCHMMTPTCDHPQSSSPPRRRTLCGATVRSWQWRNLRFSHFHDHLPFVFKHCRVITFHLASPWSNAELTVTRWVLMAWISKLTCKA